MSVINTISSFLGANGPRPASQAYADRKRREAQASQTINFGNPEGVRQANAFGMRYDNDPVAALRAAAQKSAFAEDFEKMLGISVKDALTDLRENPDKATLNEYKGAAQAIIVSHYKTHTVPAAVEQTPTFVQGKGDKADLPTVDTALLEELFTNLVTDPRKLAAYIKKYEGEIQRNLKGAPEFVRAEAQKIIDNLPREITRLTAMGFEARLAELQKAVGMISKMPLIREFLPESILRAVENASSNVIREVSNRSVGQALAAA